MELFEFKDQHLQLLPQKAIFWKEEKTLLIADTHFGKITHFRKSGIALPDRAAHQNLLRLEGLIMQWNPEKVIFLGDLFHSEMNTEWLMFKALIKRFGQVQFQLIQGNHDILHRISYTTKHFELVETPLSYGPFLMSHEPVEDSSLYNLCGHIHPGVRLVGIGRQSLRFPCFFFGEKGGILPAFGEFTGLCMLQPTQSDNVFMIVDKKVVRAA